MEGLMNKMGNEITKKEIAREITRDIGESAKKGFSKRSSLT